MEVHHLLTLFRSFCITVSSFFRQTTIKCIEHYLSLSSQLSKLFETFVFTTQNVRNNFDNYGVCVTNLLHCSSIMENVESACIFQYCWTVMRKGKVGFLSVRFAFIIVNSNLKTSEMLKKILTKLNVGFSVQMNGKKTVDYRNCLIAMQLIK